MELEKHTAFTEWAVAKGVKLNGIAARAIPGRGVGMVAVREVRAGEQILTIPSSALRTEHTVPKHISASLGAISVHGLLATSLAMDTSPVRAPWRSVLPTHADFAESMPVLWHPSLQALLPPEAASLLKQQQQKVSRDWTTVSANFPNLTYDVYLYNWLLVNTRTFYYTSGSKRKGQKQRPAPVNHDDCMALLPLADEFNHADDGCSVTFTAAGYQFCTERALASGEEVYISYGSHSNDFLLAEYGFILEENRWDSVPLDTVLLPIFSEPQKKSLQEVGFWGQYVIDKEGLCYRTQIALRLLCMPLKRWERLVANGLGDGDEFQAGVNEAWKTAAKEYSNIVEERLRQVKVLNCGLESQRETLDRRWRQIRLLLHAACGRSVQ